MLGVSLFTGCLQAPLVPQTRNALQFIQLILAVVVADFDDCAGPACVLELVRLEGMVVHILWALEPLQGTSASDSNGRANWKVGGVRPAKFAHADA